jgi:rRNA maturation protein Nop10
MLSPRLVYLASVCTRREGKVHPRIGYEDPEGEWRYSSTLSLTFSLDGGVWSVPRPSRFTPRKRPGTHCTGGLGGLQSRSGRVQIISPPPGFDPKTV